MSDPSLAGLSDEALALRCREGAASAKESLAVLYERYHVGLYTFLARYVGNESLAEDLLQETFLRAFRALPRFVPQNSFASWLYTIALNAARDYLRKRSLRALPAGGEDLAVDHRTPETALQQKEQGDRVARLLKSLPEEERAVLVLSRLEGRKMAEVAQIVGCSLRTTQYRLSSAIDRLSRGMESLDAAR